MTKNRRNSLFVSMVIYRKQRQKLLGFIIAKQQTLMLPGIFIANCQKIIRGIINWQATNFDASRYIYRKLPENY